MKKETYAFDSFNEMTIHGYKWLPEGPVRACVLISHGMAETIERYEGFAEYLCNAGIAVYGHSHRGHGKTAGVVENLGILGDKGWQKMKEDLKKALDLMKADFKETSNLPVLVFGHSMGSFLLRDFLLDYSSDIDAAIISGTGYMPKPLIKMGALVSGLVVAMRGPRYRSKFIDKLSFGTYNKKITPNETPVDWLSRDKKEVKKYIEDPFCGVMHSASFFNDFLSNMSRVLYAPTFKAKKANLPLFIFSGSEDPVGDYGIGVEKARDYYLSEGFDVTFKLYEGGRHEMLNEINRDEVFGDVLKYIESHL